MVLFDTNALLRYVLQDNKEMADSVEQQLSDNVCYIPVEVIAECVYVLSKVYNVEREIVAQTLTGIAGLNNIRVSKDEVVQYALGLFSSSMLDFVDCLLVGYTKEKRYSVFTFDKKLQKQLDKIK